jgi:membrane-associated phospholipid phosphatase
VLQLTFSLNISPTWDDGLTNLVVFIAMLFSSYRLSIALVAAAVVQLAVSQLSKRVLFQNMGRPKMLLKATELYFVKGVDVYGKFSFPSGYTLTAFSIATFLVLAFPEKRWVAWGHLTMPSWWLLPVFTLPGIFLWMCIQALC